LDPHPPPPTDETTVPDTPPAPESPNPLITPTAPPEDPTVGTGSVIGIGCTVFVVIFVCIGVAIFMWRQVN
jgi:hypothetical protein